MCKATFVLSILVAILIAESSCQGFRIIRPTYRPPPRRPVIIRARRDAPANQPLWLNQGDIPRAPATGDHPFLPKYIDDIRLDPNRRYARSVDSPSAKRGGGSHSVTGGDRHTGPTHPGYNRRHARSIKLPLDPLRPQKPFGPFKPLPRPRKPFEPFQPQRPGPLPLYPIYV